MQSATMMRMLDGTGAGKIKHIVYIVQENRSFDNLFQGYPGADTVSSGKDSYGHTIQLQPVSLSAWYVIDHSAESMFAACNGTGKLPGTDCRMNGFNKEPAATSVASSIRSTSTRRTRNRNRTSTWRTRGSSPTGCSSRSSTRASSRINTSSPRRPIGASTFRAARGVAAAAATTRSRRSR